MFFVHVENSCTTGVPEQSVLLYLYQVTVEVVVVGMVGQATLHVVCMN